MKQKSIFITVVTLLILVFAAGAFMFNKQRTEQAERVLAQNRQLLVRAHAPGSATPTRRFTSSSSSTRRAAPAASSIRW